ncbi:MAG: ABC transporter ATP-binding protein [Lachnospiraceae bacterium]|nr:ABC transporter ATP-binding protein [Lachnospiraceae bacterium]
MYKEYDNEEIKVPVLFDIDLDVEEGEYLVIMGHSGSGKSTLMNIIGCLDEATSGEYILDGEDVSKKSDNELADIRNKTIGFVFQTFNLLPKETAQVNVALPLLYAGVPKQERMERAKEALEKMGLGDRMDFLPNQLSGGQKQRVAIARAIVTNPKILLADEPTGALDTASGMQIMDLFSKLNEEGITIIMITHEPDIAAYGKRMVVIQDGRLKSAEKPKKIEQTKETLDETEPTEDNQE